MPKQRQHILCTYIKTLKVGPVKGWTVDLYIKTLKVGPVKGWTVDLLLYNMN